MERSRPRLLGVLVWGTVAVSLYLVAAGLTFRAGVLPVRPFFEGTAPPEPYRWVNPPSELAAGNRPPSRGEGTLGLTADGSEVGTVVTDDAQAIVSFQKASLRARPGEKQIRVTIEPLDPESLGAAPDGMRFDGNAYRIVATYEGSSAPAEGAVSSCDPAAEPKRCPILILRYSIHATDLYRWTGRVWEALEATPAPASLQIFAETPRLGTFVAAGPLGVVDLPGGSNVGNYLAVAIGAIAVVAAIFLRLPPARRWLRRARKRRAKAAAARAKSGGRPKGRRR